RVIWSTLTFWHDVEDHISSPASRKLRVGVASIVVDGVYSSLYLVRKSYLNSCRLFELPQFQPAAVECGLDFATTTTIVGCFHTNGGEIRPLGFAHDHVARPG